MTGKRSCHEHAVWSVDAGQSVLWFLFSKWFLLWFVVTTGEAVPNGDGKGKAHESTDGKPS